MSEWTNGEEPSRARADVLARAREVAAIAAREAARVDEEAAFPTASMQALRDSGLIGLMVPLSSGGYGASFRTMAEVAMILSASCLSTGLIWAMHSQQVAVVADHAPPPLRDCLLPRVARGQLYLASVTTERAKGGHLLSAEAPLVTRDGSLVLEREAPVVTGGPFADGYLITMRASPDSSAADVVLVYADRAQLDLTVTSTWNALGVRGTHSVGMSMRGTLPIEQLVTPNGEFRQLAVSTMIPVGHIAWAACWLGAALGALQQMLAIFRDPQARKGYNLQSDLFAARLGRIRSHINTLEAYLQQTIALYERARAQGLGAAEVYESAHFNIRINDLKILASELSFQAVDELIQLAGLRFGYSRNPRAPLERFFRDLRSASLMYANDRLLVANGKLSLLDRDLLPS